MNNRALVQKDLTDISTGKLTGRFPGETTRRRHWLRTSSEVRRMLGECLRLDSSEFTPTGGWEFRI